MEVPDRISWSRVDTDFSVRLRDYEVTDGIVWPTTIEHTSTHTPGAVSTRMTFYLHIHAFNSPMDAETFRIENDDDHPY